MMRTVSIAAFTVMMLLFTAAMAVAQHAGHGGKPQAAQKAEETPAEAPTVEIPEDKQQLIGIKIAPAVYKDVRKTIRTVGRVELDERRTATIAPKFEGWLEKPRVDYTSSPVGTGQ